MKSSRVRLSSFQQVLVVCCLLLFLPLVVLAGERFSSIEPDEAYQLIQSESELQLIDVRTLSEYNEQYIEGARLLPVSEFISGLDTIKKEVPVLLYCAVGGRSYMAGRYLESKGFTRVYNLSGGIKLWQEEGLPVVKP